MANRLLYLVLLLFFLSCLTTEKSRSRKYIKDETPTQKEEKTLETKEENRIVITFLDTLNKGRELVLSDNDFYTTNENVTESGGAGSLTTTTATVPEKRFRIQVLASSKIETVREAKKELEKKISEQISIGYEAPYYKLYVGSFSKKADARNLLMKLKNMGYSDAWVVACSDRQEN